MFGTPETGVKPDPAPFHRVLDALDVGPDQAVHVGNSLAADVAGAQAAGMAAAWLRVADDPAVEASPEYVVDELAELHGRPFPWERS